VLAGAVVESIGLLLFIPLFGFVIEPNSASRFQRHASFAFELLGADTRDGRLAVIVTAFALLMVLRGIIITAREVLLAQLGIGFIQRIRSRVGQRMTSARWDIVTRLRHSRVTHAMGAGLQQVSGASGTLLRDAVAVVMLAVQGFLAFILAPWLAAFAIMVTIVGTVALVPTIKRARAVGSFVNTASLSLVHNVSQFLGGLKLATSQNLQDRFLEELEATQDALKAKQVRYVRDQTISRAIVAFLTALIAIFIVVVGITVFDMESALLLTMFLIFARMNGPVAQLQRDAQYLAEVLPAYEALLELEADLVAAEDKCVAEAPFTIPHAQIVFDDVSFAHQGEPRARGELGSVDQHRDSEHGGVSELSLRIEPGSVVGLTGPSGAGKTTFADLLVGLYPPQVGRIRIGDVPLVGPALAGWRSQVSYVAQDAFLFHDTVRRNLLWSAPHADDDALWDALRLVEADKMLQRAAQGLDTVVGERGTLLSGGERQRIALARAILRQPRLLVLDEATNAIDVESERALFEKLLALRPRPTIVIIAHRHASLAMCERLIVLDGGRIISDVNRHFS